MYHWNQDNFEGLKSVGERYLPREGYEAFANYCLLKEKGLKKPALASIGKFIASAKKKSLGEQKEIAHELASLGFWNGNIHQLIPYPLQQYLLKVLTFWVREDGSDAATHRWLGYVSGDLTSFETALEIDPKDAISITRLIQANLNDVDYQTHHLSESKFIGELSDAKTSLEKAAQLTARLEAGEVKNSMLEDLKYYQRLVNIWEEYNLVKPPDTFPDWCISKGEKFNFWSIVYYDE